MAQDEKARDQVRVVAICGSLRPGSYTRLALQVALRGARETGAEATLIDLREYQLIFCDGKEDESGYPKDVFRLREEVKRAHGVILGTPEYHGGLSGVLKNALDWASRPPTTTPLHGMPAGIMGAATGMVGTARAQLQLRQALVYTHTYPLAAPEVLVARAQDKFDASGRLQDEPTRKFIADYMESLRQWTIRLRRPAE